MAYDKQENTTCTQFQVLVHQSLNLLTLDFMICSISNGKQKYNVKEEIT